MDANNSGAKITIFTIVWLAALVTSGILCKNFFDATGFFGGLGLFLLGFFAPIIAGVDAVLDYLLFFELFADSIKVNLGKAVATW